MSCSKKAVTIFHEKCCIQLERVDVLVSQHFKVDGFNRSYKDVKTHFCCCDAREVHFMHVDKI